jgi:hypothetical protein
MVIQNREIKEEIGKCIGLFIGYRLNHLGMFFQSYKGKVKTHNYTNRQNQSTTGKL